MAWKKGTPRKGYIKADGTVHAPKPTRVKVVSGVDIDIESTLPSHNHQRNMARICWRCAWYFRYGTPFVKGQSHHDAQHEGR